MRLLKLFMKILNTKIHKNWSCLRIVLIFSTISLLLFLLIGEDPKPRSKPNSSPPINMIRKKCYTHQVKNDKKYSESVEYFEDLILSSKQPEPSKSIFFVSANCSDTGLLRITQR